MAKIRLIYAIAICLIIAAGLATRMWESRIPEFIAVHFGDALWACMIYCAIRLIIPHKRLEWALLCSFLFCMAIEFSQLYQAGWIQAIRGTTLGGLVLGHGFLPIDFVRYGAGILFVYAADRLLLSIHNRRKKEHPSWRKQH